MNIYEKIFARLEEINMSQIELSRRTGIATSTISDWRKKQINPQADKLVAICKALDMSLVDLLCDEEDKKNEFSRADYVVGEQFIIDSFATSTEEIGNPPHRGTVKKLREVGIPLVPHRAKQITWADYNKFDYIIGMDTANIRNLNRMLRNDPEGKIYKFLTFAGTGRDIADPWYTGNFDETYEDVMEGCDGFLKYLTEQGEIYR